MPFKTEEAAKEPSMFGLLETVLLTTTVALTMATLPINLQLLLALLISTIRLVFATLELNSVAYQIIGAVL